MEKIELKRESGIVEIKGGTDQDKKDALDHFKLKFEDQGVSQKTREKTSKELEFIRELNKAMGEFVTEFGGVPIEVRPENIHIVDYSKLNKKSQKAVENYSYAAFYNPTEQAIVILLSSDIPKLYFARVLAHEIMHFNSYQTAVIREKSDKSGTSLQPKRVGLNAYKDENISQGSLFRDLDEAVTEELVKRFDKRFFEKLAYTSEAVQKRNKFREELKADETKDPDLADDIAYYSSQQLEDGSFKTNLERYNHIKERNKLWSIIDEIHSKNGQDKEEIFNVFARTALSGDLRPLTSLIEETLGPGSFKKLGEETKYKS